MKKLITSILSFVFVISCVAQYQVGNRSFTPTSRGGTTIPPPSALYTLCGETSVTSGCTSAWNSPYYVYDTSGNNNLAGWQLGAGTLTAGTNVPYVTVPPSGGYILAPTVTLTTLPIPFTICIWSKPYTGILASIPLVFAFMTPGQWDGWYVGESSTGTSIVGVSGGNFATIDQALTSPVSENVWTHICAEVSVSNMYIYMNGTLGGSASRTQFPGLGTPQFQISGAGMGHGFVGEMADVRVFNSILTATQINAIYLQAKH